MAEIKAALTTCPACACDNCASIVRGPFSTRYNGVAVTVADVEYLQCSLCGEQTFSPDQAEAASLAVKNAVRQQLGVLAPNEVSAIRRRLGVSQAELEDLLGLGPRS